MTACLRRNALLAFAATGLLALSTVAAAREVRLQGPNGDGGTCPEAAAAAAAAAGADTGSTPPARRPAGTHAGKAKATPMVRGNGDAEAAARPRWHSFLPGMFR